MTRDLELEVSLLEAEAAFLEQLVTAGILPKGARRVPSDHELRAGVRFAELDRLVAQAAGLLLRKSEAVREHVLNGLAEQLAPLLGEADPWVAVEQLDRLTDPANPAALEGLEDLINRTAAELEDDLAATAAASAQEAISEARRQGIPDRLIAPPNLDRARQAAAAHARRVAAAPARRLLDAAAMAGSSVAASATSGAEVLAGALDGAEAASIGTIEDTARQAANVAHGEGRAAGQAALPAPREVYASELLDSSTCGPCAELDGRTYDSLESGLVDYPGAGGYIGCEGGARCRGTLVLVHATEAAPTLDDPGDGRGPEGPGGQPTDRTPRGPSGIGRPDHIGESGEVRATRPQLPDLGAIGIGVDELGRTVAPAIVSPPIEAVAPGQLERDPELAELSDDQLDAILVDTSDLERQYAAADELDARAAGTRSRVWREDELDAATLAQYEEDRLAWEAAGGYAADAVAGTGAKGGRLRDRVRAAWSEHIAAVELEAEDATRGYWLRRDREAEFRAKYGDPSRLFTGPARIAYYYASPELRDYWQDNPRLSFDEFALERGITDAKTRARAAKAAEARHSAQLIAEETEEGRAKRRARARKPRRELTAGERLALDQRRRDRIRRAEGGAT